MTTDDSEGVIALISEFQNRFGSNPDAKSALEDFSLALERLKKRSAFDKLRIENFVE